MRTLILAPHPDDEINLAGQLLYGYPKKDRDDVFIAFMTNGDYYPYEAERRMRETLNSAKVLGVMESHVFFMGFGDDWVCKEHIYHKNGDELCHSKCGRTKTYALSDHEDYAFQKNGKHLAYTRNNFLAVLCDIILSIKADVIITTDYDYHADHRALSLFFEEAMGIILRKDSAYQPLVLKRFAYVGVWFGPSDYHLNRITKRGNDSHSLFVNPSLSWDERIRFAAPKGTTGVSLFKNPIWKAGKAHRSQIARYRTKRICNSDIIYFQRRCDSLSYRGEMQVSSGIGSYLVDFKRIDTSNVEPPTKCPLNASLWIPDSEDKKKRVTFSWKDAVTISYLEVYDNPEKTGGIKLTLLDDKGHTLDCTMGEQRGNRTCIHLANPTLTKTLTFDFSAMERPEISELEIYEKEKAPDVYATLPYPYKETAEGFSLLLLLEMAWITVMERCKICYRKLYHIWCDNLPKAR